MGRWRRRRGRNAQALTAAARWGFPSDSCVDLPLPVLTRADAQRQRAAERIAREEPLSAVRHLCRRGSGLVSAGCRREAWPRLLGITPSEVRPVTQCYPHPERGQIDLDLARSLWLVPDAHRPEFRERSRRVLLAALTDMGSEGASQRWYYQGLHDVAAVLILVLGESTAAAALRRLVEWHLAPWVRKGSRFRDVLVLIPPLVQHGDPELGAALDATLGAAGMSADYALSWILTWFAHEYDGRLDVVSRIFDFLLASPPLMIVYLAAACTLSMRDELLLGDDFADHWQTLQRTPLSPALDEWFATAERLFSSLPPEQLVCIVYGDGAPDVLHPSLSPLFVAPGDPCEAPQELRRRAELALEAVGPAGAAAGALVALPPMPRRALAPGGTLHPLQRAALARLIPLVVASVSACAVWAFAQLQLDAAQWTL
eukprot:TRINITY_DN55954_c0_g1_i1.p1 TRINITY_DN55954_c0_g1~~TRINITY_DN55954_c0_g1_i1.p1  ORF type:complete len:451 (+),score=83.40 TRINITY_DN55954_c0_g1_i1:67-1353(+)